MSWIPSEEQLDPIQTDFFNKEHGFLERKNVWIKGFPGSGKSVLLVYAIKKILDNKKDAKILVVLFTRSLVDLYQKGFKEMKLKVDVTTVPEFYKKGETYDHIFCDEVQDLSSSTLQAILNKSKHVITAGDANQSIYEREPYEPKEKTLYPYDIPRLINGEDFELVYIHRLSRSVICAVQKLMPEMNIFGAKRDATKKDVQIRIYEASDRMQEVKYVMNEAQRYVNHNFSTAILLPTAEKVVEFCNICLETKGKRKWNVHKNRYNREDWGCMNEHLKRFGIVMEYVGNGYGSLLSAEKNKNIVIMTYHSAKGLDFENVFIPFANDELFRYTNFNNSKTLFMVAMTRSKTNLYISYCGKMHGYVSAFGAEKSICSYVHTEDFTQSFDADVILDF